MCVVAMPRQESHSSVESTELAVSLPVGLPGWITAELIALTLETWQPHYNKQLTVDDAVRILRDVSRLFDALEVTDGETVRRAGEGLKS